MTIPNWTAIDNRLVERQLEEIRLHTGIEYQLVFNNSREVVMWDYTISWIPIHCFYIPGLNAYEAFEAFYWAWVEQCPCPF